MRACPGCGQVKKATLVESLVKFWQVVAEIHLIKDNTFDEGVVRAWSNQNFNMPQTIPQVLDIYDKNLVEIRQVVAEFHLIQDNTFGEGVAKAWPDQNVNMPKTTPGV